MTLSRGLKNVILISVSYLLSRTSFFTLLNLLKVIKDDLQIDHPKFEIDVNYCYAIYEGCVCISVLTAPILFKYVTPKWAIIYSEIYGIFYCLQFLVPNTLVFNFFNAVSGFCAGLTVVATGTLLSLNSRKEEMQRNSAIHWFIAELSKVIGGVLGAAILGVGVTKVKRIIFFCIFAALDLVAGIVASFLQKPIFQTTKSPTTKEILKGSWRLITSKDMWLLMVTFSYTGWLEAYEVGTYGAKVAYTRAFYSIFGAEEVLIAILCLTILGAGECTAALLYILLRIQTADKHLVVIGGFGLHFMAAFCILINIPDVVDKKVQIASEIFVTIPGEESVVQSSIILAFISSFLLGLGDSAFYTQVYSMLGVKFERNVAAAFMIYKVVQKTTSVSAYLTNEFYGNNLMVGILVGLLVTGTVTFVYVHLRPSFYERGSILVHVDDMMQTRDNENIDVVLRRELAWETKLQQERIRELRFKEPLIQNKFVGLSEMSSDGERTKPPE